VVGNADGCVGKLGEATVILARGQWRRVTLRCPWKRIADDGELAGCTGRRLSSGMAHLLGGDVGHKRKAATDSLAWCLAVAQRSGIGGSRGRATKGREAEANELGLLFKTSQGK
jgi:hypothetical protein